MRSGEALARVRLHRDLLFRLADDFVHHGDGFARPLACGGLSAQHDSVGTVVDCVSDVAGFRAGWPRIFDHRFEHLRRGDDGLTILRGATDDLLLNGGDFFRRHFNTEIAARNHDAVGNFKNRVEMVDGLRLFELGDDPALGAERCDAIFYEADVFAGPDERHCDRVNTGFQREGQIFFVFFCQRGNAHGNPWQVDALVLAERAAVDDVDLDVDAIDLADMQLNQAVGQEDARAGHQIFRQRGEGGADQRRRSRDVAGRDAQLLAALQLDRDAILQPAGADFWTLQVSQDADRLAEVL